jgi:hypothetical protein
MLTVNIKILLSSIMFLSLISCQKVESNPSNTDFDKIEHIESNKIILNLKYRKTNFPVDSKILSPKSNVVNLDDYSFNIDDIKLFYSGEEKARILSILPKKIGEKEYLLALIAVNFDNYEGAGPAQVVFLSGGDNSQGNYKNTLFIPLGGFFPILENQINKFREINNNSIKDYCVQSFILNSDLSKKEEMRCIGQDPSVELKDLKFNVEKLGYDEL